MLRDAGSIPDGVVVPTDVCVVGAGPAGITLARELSRSRHRVCVLEAGGLAMDGPDQRFLRGELAGLPYPPLDRIRSAALGGTTNRWVGTCRRLDAIDFDVRPWVPLSGWPLSLADLAPCYARAEELCQLSPLPGEVPAAGPRLTEDVDLAAFRLSPTRFGRAYGAELARLTAVTVLLHARVVELRLLPGGRHVDRVHVAGAGRSGFAVTAAVFVLAAGGIENARLLLLSGDGGGLGNEHDLVGRCFMEHPAVRLGTMTPATNARPLSPTRSVGETALQIALVPAIDTTRRESLLGGNVVLVPRPPAGIALARRVLESARWRLVPDSIWLRIVDRWERIGRTTIRSRVGASDRPPGVSDLLLRAEQAPNPESRVTLAESTDALGRRRARLDWRLGPLDQRSMRRTAEIVGRALEVAGVGRVHLTLPEADVGWRAPGGLGHHMGTTRMHTDPRQGVVDEHGRVHALSNLFVAGSSVFPTGGHANPTLTIVALSLRLADHLRRLLESTGAAGRAV